ncbi:MAG: 2-dehydropantoate 2-reductase [Chloroflexi bacterium]|nr:2-dehydropantoate 2-reductase [Chloroflexota bacterium]
MKIVVLGTGGVGGYYGGLLARQGLEVTFVARRAHLEALRRNGLQVKSVHGDFHVQPVHATDQPAEAGVVDLALVCVKAYDTDEAARALQPCLGEESVVVSLQNGIDAGERIGAIVGMERILGGATYISSAVEAPGVIRQFSQFRRIVLGEFNGETTPRLQSVFAALNASGATVEMTADILKVLWTKFLFISAASSLGALTRLPMGDYRNVPEARALLIQIMREVEALAHAQGIRLDQDVVAGTLAFIDSSPPHIRPSMQLDVETGHRSELEAIIGVIGRKGRSLGVPTPAADMVYAALLPSNMAAERK